MRCHSILLPAATHRGATKFHQFKWPQSCDCNSTESSAKKPFNHQLFLLKSQSTSFQRTDSISQTLTHTPMQSYAQNLCKNKEKRKHLLFSYLNNFKFTPSLNFISKEKMGLFQEGGPLKSWWHPVLAVSGQGFCSQHNANHRWVSSLDAIDMPHEKESTAPPKDLAATTLWGLLVSPPHRLVSSSFLYHAYFRDGCQAVRGNY